MSPQKVPKDYLRPCPRALHDSVSGQHPQPFGTNPEATADKPSVVNSDQRFSWYFELASVQPRRARHHEQP
jgi:hypothetical protein